LLKRQVMKHAIHLCASALLFVAACSGASGEEGTPGTDSEAPSIPMPGGDPSAPAPPAETPSNPGSPPAPAPPAPPGPAPAPSAAAFVGAPAYTATLGPSTIDVSGKGNGHLSFNAAGNPAGQACLTCHDGAGKGGAPAFLFAGTVYENAATGKVAARVEVRLLGADGKGTTTYTDENGNFFFRQNAGTFVAPAIAGVRNATMVQSMANKINDGNCNQCHGATARLTL
jgi:hypothetical protein